MSRVSVGNINNFTATVEEDLPEIEETEDETSVANNIRLNKIRRLAGGSNFLKRNKIDKIAIDDVEKEDTDLDRENTQDADNITERISNLAPDSSQL